MRGLGRWGVLVVFALAVGAWSGRVVGAPTTPVAQSSGTSSSGSGSSGSSGGSDGTSNGSSGGSGGGDNGSGSGGSGSGGSGGSGGSDGSGSGSGGSGGSTDSGSDGSGSGGSGGDGSGSGGGDSTDPGGSGGSGGSGSGDGAQAVEPSHVAAAEPTDQGCADGTRCYTVEQADGVEGARLPDGTVIVLGDAPVVNVDSGASTSASSNVDLRVDVDVDTGDVIRVERHIDPVRQFAVITFAALFGVLVGAAVLGTFLRFRNGPRTAR